MHGLRKLTGLAVALLCLLYIGPVGCSEQTKSAQQTKPPATGNEPEGKKRPPIDDDDVVVNPKGKGGGLNGGDPSGVGPWGLTWSQDRQVWQKGNPRKFRCDLYGGLYKLQVRVKIAADPVDAEAVHFVLDDIEFGVTKTAGGKYFWYDVNEGLTSCKRCVESGVPPEFMDPRNNKDGYIKARLSSDPGTWVLVDEVRMKGYPCK
jgi:hypothetical protein